MSRYTLNGTSLQSITLKLPRLGVWIARAKIAGDKVPAIGAAATIVLGDLTLNGTTRSGGVYVSSAECVVVGGKDGWSKTVGESTNRTDIGVKLSKVAGDLGRDAGETIKLVEGTDGSLGYAWPRSAGRASQALDALGVEWWVAADGTTWLGTRPSTVLPKTVKWTLQAYDPANRIATLGVEADTLAGFQPGVRLTRDGMDITVGSVVVSVTDRKATIEVWGL